VVFKIRIEGPYNNREDKGLSYAKASANKRKEERGKRKEKREKGDCRLTINVAIAIGSIGGLSSELNIDFLLITPLNH